MSLLRRLFARRRENPAFVAVAVVALLALATYPAVDWYLRTLEIAPPYKFWDWGAYSAAVDRWVEGNSVYVQTEEDGYHGGYLYPPVVLLLFAPFALLFPFNTGATLWLVCSVLLLWGALQALVGALGYSLRPRERAALLPVVVGFQPLLIAAKLAQTAPALGGALTLAAAASLRGRAYASGVLTACCGVVKLPYAPAGAHLLGNRKRFLGAVGGGLALVALSLLVFGLDTHRAYLDVLAWGIREGSSSRSPLLWLPAYYRPLYSVPHSFAVRVAASLAIVVGVLRARPDAVREITALGFAAVPLLAPLTYTYYFVAALPAVVLLVAAELDREDGYPAVPVVGLLFMHAHSYGLWAAAELVPSWPEWVPHLLLQPGLWGNLLVVGLAAARVAAAGGPLGWRALVPDGE